MSQKEQSDQDTGDHEQRLFHLRTEQPMRPQRMNMSRTNAIGRLAAFYSGRVISAQGPLPPSSRAMNQKKLPASTVRSFAVNLLMEKSRCKCTR